MGLYARYIGVYDLEALQALADVTDDVVTESMKPLLSSGITYVNTVVKGLGLENDQVAVAATGAGAGGIAEAITAPQVSFAIRRLAGLTGRSARGRVYLPPPIGTQVNANKNFLNVATADAWVDALMAWNSAIVAESWFSVIVSRTHAGALRTFGITFPVILWSYHNLRLDTQRRRLVE
jgi:hypothetical protein